MTEQIFTSCKNCRTVYNGDLSEMDSCSNCGHIGAGPSYDRGPWYNQFKINIEEVKE
jgi:hypothetical protein